MELEKHVNPRLEGMAELKSFAAKVRFRRVLWFNPMMEEKGECIASEIPQQDTKMT